MLFKPVNDHNIESVFLETPNGRLFSLLRHPKNQSTEKGCIFYFPPFAEEMNKSKRMFTLQSQEFLKSGFSVFSIDLFGCGDSEGEFKEANWDIWRENIASAVEWIRGKGYHNINFWGLRLGCLLMMDYLKLTKINVNIILFWNPVTSGELFIKQFFRLKIAEDLKTANRLTVKDLFERLSLDNSIEIAGYEINASLVNSIRQIKMENFIPPLESKVYWVEVTLSDAHSISIAGQKVINGWNKENITTFTMGGEPFWQTAEITVNNKLIEFSAKFMNRRDEI